MTKFKDIQAATIIRNRNAATLKKKLPNKKSNQELAAIGDDRYLSSMSLRIFSAGLKHPMVPGKWAAFEKEFCGFESKKIRAMSNEDLEALMSDRRIIRH